jgi:UDP-N-acetylmuramate--alanine ligase
MVAEADESDGSFLRMKPTIAVVTNIDREHLDHYPDLGAIQDTFVQFLSRVPFYGAAVVCLDDPNVRAILPQIDRKTLTYGLSHEAEVAASDVELEGFGSSYVAVWQGNRLGKVRLSVPGRHAVYNSLAAVAVALELEVPFHSIAAGLKRFRNPDRRFQRRGEAFGATVIDDYAHHPTEIMATLSAVREGFGARTVAVFQPHRYSRTQALLEEFGRAFVLADRVIVTEIFGAGEDAIPGVSGKAVADALVRHGHPSATFEPDLGPIPGLLSKWVRPGDLVLTLGAGNVWKVAEALVRSDAAQRGSRGAGRKH